MCFPPLHRACGSLVRSIVQAEGGPLFGMKKKSACVNELPCGELRGQAALIGRGVLDPRIPPPHQNLCPPSLRYEQVRGDVYPN